MATGQEDGERERERDSRGKNERERGKEREISLKVLQHEMSRDSRACESITDETHLHSPQTSEMGLYTWAMIDREAVQHSLMQFKHMMLFSPFTKDLSKGGSGHKSPEYIHVASTTY